MGSQFQTPAIPLQLGLSSSDHYRSSVEYFQQLRLQPPIKLEREVVSFYSRTNDDEATSSSTTSSISNSPSRSDLKSHKKDSYSCNVCGRVLSSASSYYVHMKQHSGHKPYHCPLCEVSFCRKPYLEVHMRTHTGERPFHCDICSKKFSQKSSLNIHKRVHTGERPYACEICDKKFAVKSYVDAHKWTHVTDKPIICEECHIPFNSRVQYIAHLRTHSSLFSHECPCGRTFAKDSYLIRHQIKVHRSPATPGPNHSLNVPYNSMTLQQLYNHVGNMANGMVKPEFLGCTDSLLHSKVENIQDNISVVCLPPSSDSPQLSHHVIGQNSPSHSRSSTAQVSSSTSRQSVVQLSQHSVPL